MHTKQQIVVISETWEIQNIYIYKEQKKEESKLQSWKDSWRRNLEILDLTWIRVLTKTCLRNSWWSWLISCKFG